MEEILFISNLDNETKNMYLKELNRLIRKENMVFYIIYEYLFENDFVHLIMKCMIYSHIRPNCIFVKIEDIIAYLVN